MSEPSEVTGPAERPPYAPVTGGSPATEMTTGVMAGPPCRACSFGHPNECEDPANCNRRTPVARYRKKPVVINAVQIVPDNDAAILAFMDATRCPFEITGHYEMVIHTLEGDLHLSTGDWLIQGVQGEFYPCKPDIFEATYEPADA